MGPWLPSFLLSSPDQFLFRVQPDPWKGLRRSPGGPLDICTFDFLILLFWLFKAGPPLKCVYMRGRERWELGREVGREGDVGREEALVWER